MNREGYNSLKRAFQLENYSIPYAVEVGLESSKSGEDIHLTEALRLSKIAAGLEEKKNLGKWLQTYDICQPGYFECVSMT